MNKFNFKASLAKAAFALATVLTLSLAFTACGNDVPTPPGPDPKPNPDPEQPTVELKDGEAMINNEKMEVDHVTIENLQADQKMVTLYFKDGSYFYISCYDSQNGKEANLTSTDIDWVVSYYANKNNRKFWVTDGPGDNKCDRGSMLWSLDNSGQFSIEIKDAHISASANTAGDKKDYTFALKWRGTPKLVPYKSAVINGVEKMVDHVDVFNYYSSKNVRLYFRDGTYIFLDCYNTQNGVPANLTSNDGKWFVGYADKNKDEKFLVSEHPANDKCDRGSMLWKLDDNGQFSVEIKDAHISASANTKGDKQDYTFALKWSGKPRLRALASAVLDGVEKEIVRAEVNKRIDFVKDKEYDIRFYLSDGCYLNITAYDVQNGKPIDLTKTGGRWALGYVKTVGDNKFLINDRSYGDKFDRGTMLWSFDKYGQFIIKVTDGYISKKSNRSGDHKEHNFELNWIGYLKNMPSSAPARPTRAVRR